MENTKWVKLGDYMEKIIYTLDNITVTQDEDYLHGYIDNVANVSCTYNADNKSARLEMLVKEMLIEQAEMIKRRLVEKARDLVITAI